MPDVEYGALAPVLEVKAAGDTFEVSGHVSTWGNVDSQGDAVMRGAFDETLRSGRKVKFLMGHDARLVLGVPVELKSDERGLFGRFKISRTALGHDVHTLLKDGALDSFSIGYIPTEIEFDESGVRLLKSIDLLECSVVAIPANDQALVTGVKQAEVLTLPKLLKAFDAELARHQAAGAALDAADRELLRALRDGADALLAPEATEAKAADPDPEPEPEPVPARAFNPRLRLTGVRLRARGLLDCAL